MNKTHRRCPTCSRLLVPNKEGRFPKHKTPPKPTNSYMRGVVPFTRLTGNDDPWCEGGNKYVV